MSLRWRLAWFGGLVVVASLLTFGVLIYLLSEATQASDQDKALSERAGEAAGALRTAPALVPTAQSPAVLAGATDLTIHTDEFVEVVSGSGTVLSTTARVGTAVPVTPDARLSALAEGGGGKATINGAGGIELRVVVQPWSSPGIPSGGYVIAAQPTSIRSTNLHGLRSFLIIASIPMILVGLAASWLVSGRAIRPLKLVAETAEAIRTTRDRRRRLPEGKRHDELGQLSRSFNGMLDELEATYAQVTSALETQRQFIADASHELRTPLTTIRGNAGFLARGPSTSEEDRVAAVNDIARESDRMHRMTEALLVLARADAGQELAMEPIQLHDVVQDVCRQARRLDDRHSIESPDFATVQIHGNDDAVRELVWILLENATTHTPPGCRIRVGVLAADGHGLLMVSDEGPGIPPADLNKIFERFYQADRSRSGRGSGLGLAIASWIVGQHQGQIWVRNNETRGCTFSVRFPLALTRL